MSDDSFIREVDEELRSERFQNFWRSYGKLVIAAAVAIIVGIAAYNYYIYSKATEAAASGDAFIAAVKLAEEGKSDEAIAAFSALEKGSNKTYQSVARLRAAAELQKTGKVQEALKQYDALAGDNAADINLRSIARIRAGLLLVDTGTVTEVEARVGPLSAPGGAYRSSAREAIGLAYYKAGDLDNAFKQFDELQKDRGTPQAMQQRVRIMLDVIASQGGPVAGSE